MVTTSERFILSNLGVLKHFRRQIPVPAVSDVRELASVLDQTGMFGGNDVQAVIGSIQNDTRSDKIGLGIKTILESIEESKVEASSQGTDMLESVANRIVTAISSNALDG